MKHLLLVSTVSLLLFACNSQQQETSDGAASADSVTTVNGVPVVEDPNLVYPELVLEYISKNDASTLYRLFDKTMLEQFNYTEQDAKRYLHFIYNNYGRLDSFNLTDNNEEEVIDHKDPNIVLDIENYLYEAHFEKIKAAIYLRLRKWPNGGVSLYSYQVNPAPLSPCPAVDSIAIPLLQAAAAKEWKGLYHGSTQFLQDKITEEEFTQRWKAYLDAEPIVDQRLYWHTMVFFEGHAFLSAEYQVNGKETAKRVYTLEFDDRDGSMKLRDFGVKLLSFDDELIPEDRKP